MRRLSDSERGVPLKAYEVGVRNSGESRDKIIGDRHHGKDVVVVKTVLEIQHHDREDSRSGGTHEWTNLPIK